MLAPFDQMAYPFRHDGVPRPVAPLPAQSILPILPSRSRSRKWERRLLPHEAKRSGARGTMRSMVEGPAAGAMFGVPPPSRTDVSSVRSTSPASLSLAGEETLGRRAKHRGSTPRYSFFFVASALRARRA